MASCNIIKLIAIAGCLASFTVQYSFADDERRQLRIEIDDEQGRPLPCRIHLTDSDGKPVQPVGLPFWRDHFICDGRAMLPLVPARYRYEIERGPEYERSTGIAEMKIVGETTVAIRLRRIANLARLGWFSGDLHVHRPLDDIELLMRAEDLHVAPVITWWNRSNTWSGQQLPVDILRRFDGNHFYEVMAGEDERGGGAMLYFHLETPLPIAQAAREHPSSAVFAQDARRLNKNVHIDAEKPFWWDFPMWVANDLVDTVGIANNHMCRSTMYADEAWGKPRETSQLAAPLGNGFWTQEIYYHLLNSGIRLPPSAGSASGVLPNPVGYNRIYVFLEGELDHARWWEGLKAGRSFVTNGPLLICKANGQLPGHVFKAAGAPMELTLDLTLNSLDRVPRIEIVKDGRVETAIELNEGMTHQRTASIVFRESGWFLIRAISDNKQTFRFASTAPFYVEIGDRKSQVSRKSADFFLNWTKERMETLSQALTDEGQRRDVLNHHATSRVFWEDVRASATAD